MITAAANIAQLRADLGDQARLLQFAPLRKSVVESLADPDAISFRIFIGYTREKDSDKKRKIWVHLYPAVSAGRLPEIQFHSDDAEDGYYAKYDVDTLSKIISGYAAAFKLPGRSSKSRLVALAKYYFLEKLVEIQSQEDIEKFKVVGIPVGKSFKEDLKMVCREFEEEAKRLSTVVALDGQRNDISDPSFNPLVVQSPALPDNNTSTPHQAVPVAQMIPAAQVAEVPRNDTTTYATNETLDKIWALSNDEEGITASLDAIDDEINTLHAKRTQLVERQKNVENKREKILQGMSLVEAFKLGREVDRMRADNSQNQDGVLMSF